MTKNVTEKVHEKHTENIRNGTLQVWRADVKSDPSAVVLEKMGNGGE
jgi:hypothetical protein